MPFEGDNIEYNENRGTAACVAVDGALYSFDKLYDYLVPPELVESALPGARVVVPFGRGGRKCIGLVFSVRSANVSERLKPVIAVVDEKPVVSPEMLSLCEWMRHNIFCTYFDAFRAIIPPGLGFSLKKHYSPAADFDGVLTPEERSFMELISVIKDKQALDGEITRRRMTDGGALVKALVEKGALIEDEELKRRVSDASVTMLRVKELTGEPLTKKQKSVVEFVERSECASLKEVRYACAVTQQVITRLVQKGILEQYDQPYFRSEPTAEKVKGAGEITLSPKQEEIYSGLLSLMNSDKPQCALLRGVTGSGKTVIFAKLISEALRQGKTALMLLPEIALTPQTVNRFRAMFGAEVAVMHSGLSLGERADEYRRIQEGGAKIVVGTRSAVFAPLDNIGIVVMDEENDTAYKSEKSPRYHARDIAKQRCFKHNALLLLISATPTAESYYFAKSGRYSLFELEERYNTARLPDVYIVDMRIEAESGSKSDISEPLAAELKENLSRGEQSILLLNRRGYHTGVTCARCGAHEQCPLCNTPLTYHKFNESLMCHYCGYTKRLGGKCPSCGSDYFFMSGTGTQRVEAEVSDMFPEARILRMDADTTAAKDAFAVKFAAFADKQYDIMVGTQMIAKGLDFPNVTLVGVLKADNMLYAPDFRAYERTFSLITQVVGRSGRGDKHGRAMIQTYSPDHYVLNLAAAQNYRDYFAEEEALRRAAVYPPFCDLITVAFDSVQNERAFKAASIFAQRLDAAAREYGGKVPLKILGPAADVAFRVGGRYHYSLTVKCVNNRALRECIEKVIASTERDNEFSYVRFYVDHE